MEIKDTVEDMNSDDYRERLVAEYRQLLIRTGKLGNAIEDMRAGELDFEPKSSLELLTAQYCAMASYASILEIRAKAEGIELLQDDEA